MTEKFTRSEPEKIEDLTKFRSKVYLTNDWGIIKEPKNPKEIFEDPLFTPANKFVWNKGDGDLRAILEGQTVLVGKFSLFSKEWHYGIVNAFGAIICIGALGNKFYELQDLDEIYIVSPAEYSINTSKLFFEQYPELQYLKNPSTNDYI